MGNSQSRRSKATASRRMPLARIASNSAISRCVETLWWRIKTPRNPLRGKVESTRLPVTETTACDSTPRFFGAPLTELMPDGITLPPVLKDILARLKADGPSFYGIFTNFPNGHQKHEVMAAIEQGEQINVEELPICLVASLLKEFLMGLPDTMFGRGYKEIVATLPEDPDMRTVVIAQAISSLPPSNRTFLFHLFDVLRAIADNEAVSKMGPMHLAISMAPSLLHYSVNCDAIITGVLDLISHTIQHTGEVFKNNVPDNSSHDNSWEGGVPEKEQSAVVEEAEKASVNRMSGCTRERVIGWSGGCASTQNLMCASYL